MSGREVLDALWADWDATEHALVCGGRVLVRQVGWWPEGPLYRVECPVCGFQGSPTLVADVEDAPAEYGD